MDKIFLCVYYTFWSILNIFKNKIIFTQNQVRHEPSEIFAYVTDLDDWDLHDKTFRMVDREKFPGFELDRNTGMITMKVSC